MNDFRADQGPSLDLPASLQEFCHVNERLERQVTELTELNSELEAFSSAVSHDLRSRIRAIDGFSHLLLDDYGPSLDGQARFYLERIRAVAGRMSELVEGLLRLSRVSQVEPVRESVDLSGIATAIGNALKRQQPERAARFSVRDGVTGEGDRMLLTVVMENLLHNAWKFTARQDEAEILFDALEEEGRRVYFVRDNGAGFDMSAVEKLFRPFQRLHEEGEFPGTGIGLATVRRIVRRHGGEIWARGEMGKGATFYFTLGSAE